MKRILCCIFILCFAVSLVGCSHKASLSLKEFAKNRDLSLIGNEVVVSLAGKNAVEQEILFSFHPEVKRLFLFYSADGDTLSQGVIFELEVEYETCEELVRRSSWTGVLRKVYSNNSVLHGNALQSIPFSYDEEGKSTVAASDVVGACYGTYAPDPEQPESFIRDGYKTDDGDNPRIGLILATSPEGIPWGFQDFYDHAKIKGLSQKS